MTDVDVDEVERCEYRECRQPLPALLASPKGGRPRKFCPDGRWGAWRSCKDGEAIARRQERAAGLEVPLDRFRATAEQLAPQLAEVAAQVAALKASVGEVEEGALAHIAEAEQDTAAARERAERSDDAVRTMQRKVQGSDAEVRQARDDVKLAQRLQRDAEQAGRESEHAAWTKVAEHEAARGKAEERATTAAANRRELQTRFAELAKTHDGLVKERNGLQQATETMKTERDAAVGERDRARELAEQRAGEVTAAAAAAATVGGERDALREQLAGVRAALEQREQELAAARELAEKRAAEVTAVAATGAWVSGERDALREQLAGVSAALEEREQELAAARERRRGSAAARRPVRAHSRVAGRRRGIRPERVAQKEG